MKQMSQLCRKGHIVLVYLRSLGNWIVHDGAKRKLERGMPASGLNTSHQHSLQGSRGLFKQLLLKTFAFVSSLWSFPFQKLSFWWRCHKMQVQIGEKNSLQQAIPPGTPHSSHAWGAEGREGRRCRNQAISKGSVVTSSWCSSWVSEMPWFSFLQQPGCSGGARIVLWEARDICGVFWSLPSLGIEM